MSDDRENQGARAATILERVFAGDEVDQHDIVEAAQQARADDGVRAHYDRLAVTDRELGGDFEDRVGEAWFLDSLDAMLEAEQAPNVVSLTPSSPGRETPRHLPGAAAVAMAALVMFGIAAVLQSQTERPQPEFQPRSVASVDESPSDAPGFEVFCVERDGGDVTFRGQRESDFATVHCPADAEIKLAVSNRNPKLRHAAFFGIASDHTLYWYGPSPAAPTAVAIETAPTLQPVGETIRLGVNHAPGTVRVIGLFTERPLEFDDVALFARSNVFRLRDGRLTIDGGTVVRQTFEVDGP